MYEVNARQRISPVERLRRIRQAFRPEVPKLFVVGAPRSGFSLLIAVINHLLCNRKFRRNPLREELKNFVPKASGHVYRAIESYFSDKIDLEDLIFSEEFKLLIGGPKWLKKDNPELACVRKYIGIKGRGDFLAVFSLPKYVMDHDTVVHSHYEPDVWLEDPYYRDYGKFASIRNPLDILNSSVFSLNALTGEYINRFVTEPAEAIRERLAVYKLTDLNFVEGLMTPLAGYLKVFVEVQDRYRVMRWEDLITNPETTIRVVGSGVGLEISSAEAHQVWEKMKYRNQTTFHVHNFRKGVPGDWKNHLVNEHLEILKSRGFDALLEALGYEKIHFLKEENYTPFQQRVSRYIRKGEVFKEFDDQDLFTFAFNKSNFRSSKYDFASLPEEGGVQVERSSIKDEELLKGFVQAVARALGPVREALKSIFSRCNS